MSEDDRWVIWSYEHDAWWRPGWMGYTRELTEAGRYRGAEAERIIQRANVVTLNEVAIQEGEAGRFRPRASIVCPFCQRRSFNLHDIAHRYCGACHRFHGDPDVAAAMTDDSLVAEAAREISALPPGGVELVLRPQSAFSLAAVLQLALRHPGLTGDPRAIAVTALEHIRGYFASCPAVREMLRRGDDPERDRPVRDGAKESST